MTAEVAFQVGTLAVIPAWLLLLLAPRARLTELVAQRVWLPAALALLYVWAQLADPSPEPDGAGFHSLAAVTALFGTPHAMLSAWLHFVVLDLLAGAWIVRDARRLDIRHRWVVPCLVVTFALAPAGLLLWFAVRAGLRREVALG